MDFMRIIAGRASDMCIVDRIVKQLQLSTLSLHQGIVRGADQPDVRVLCCGTPRFVAGKCAGQSIFRLEVAHFTSLA